MNIYPITILIQKLQVSCRIFNPDPVHAHLWCSFISEKYKRWADIDFLIPDPYPKKILHIHI